MYSMVDWYGLHESTNERAIGDSYTVFCDWTLLNRLTNRADSDLQGGCWRKSALQNHFVVCLQNTVLRDLAAIFAQIDIISRKWRYFGLISPRLEF